MDLVAGHFNVVPRAAAWRLSAQPHISCVVVTKVHSCATVVAAHTHLPMIDVTDDATGSVVVSLGDLFTTNRNEPRT